MTAFEFKNIDENSDRYINPSSMGNFLNEEEIKHNTMFGKQVRVGIIGPSGSGKTTLLKEFIKKPDHFNYSKIIVYASITSLRSGFYRNLKEAAPDVVSLVPIDLIQHLDKTVMDVKEKYFIIFDDIATVRNKKLIESVESFFAFGSKLNMHLFYLSQSNTNTGLNKFMRQNISSYIIMYGTESEQIDLIFRQVVGKDITDLDKQALKEQLNAKQYNYLIIAKQVPIEEGRYVVNDKIFRIKLKIYSSRVKS